MNGQPRPTDRGTSLSEAADRSGLTLWEMEQYLVHNGYRSDYSIEDLAREVEALDP